MALTTIHSANSVEQWRKAAFREYIRGNRFARYMSADMDSAIHVIEDLTKSKGDKITAPFLRRLTGAGVTGSTTLEGAEESLLNYGHQITIDQYRHGVLVADFEGQKSELDLLKEASPALLDWAQEHLRDKVLAALGSAKIDGKTAYASCSEAEKDAWLAANSDRVLFGAAKSNNATNDHSAALANVDSSADVLSYGIVSLAKRMAKIASPHIRPIKVGEDEEWFVMFAPSVAFRDLKTSLATINQNAEVRGRDNPLYRDGDLVWDGVIIREVPEISVITGVGASSIDVAPCYLCGAQAVGVAYAKRPDPVTNVTDYADKKGKGIRIWYGVEKLMNNSVQNGLVTVYVSGVADS